MHYGCSKMLNAWKSDVGRRSEAFSCPDEPVEQHRRRGIDGASLEIPIFLPKYLSTRMNTREITAQLYYKKIRT